MADIATKNDHLLIKDGTVLLGCGCCTPCCCTGNAAPLANTLQDFESPSLRRILNPKTTACTGVGLSPGRAGQFADEEIDGCAYVSVVAQWCDLTVEKTRNNTYYSATKSLSVVYGDYLYTSATLTFESPPFFFTDTGPFLTRCGRCVFRLRLLLILNRRFTSIFLFSQLTKRYFLDGREGCDTVANVTFLEADDNSTSGPDNDLVFDFCNEPPVVTVVYAP